MDLPLISDYMALASMRGRENTFMKDGRDETKEEANLRGWVSVINQGARRPSHEILAGYGKCRNIFRMLKKRLSSKAAASEEARRILSHSAPSSCAEQLLPGGTLSL